MIFGVISDKFMRKTPAKRNVKGVKSGSERDESMAWENLCQKLADAGERLAAQDSELAKLKRENKHLRSIVSELSQKAQDNKANEVAGGIVIPAMRYVKESPHKNFAKVQEEFIEAFEAYMVYLNHPCDETFEHLTEEATDIQMAVETFLASLGMTVEERRKAKDIVVLKNASRGYFEERKKS